MNDFLYIYVHLNLIRKGTDCCSKNRTNCYDQHDHNNHHGNHFKWCFFAFSVISKSHCLYLVTINSLALFYHEIGDFSNRAYTKRDWDKSPSLLSCLWIVEQDGVVECSKHCFEVADRTCEASILSLCSLFKLQRCPMLTETMFPLSATFNSLPDC